MGHLSKNQKMKRDFRASKPWKEFRKDLKEKQKIDPLSKRKLTKMTNCHHRDLDENNYTDLSNEEHFVMLNNYSHKTIHYLYNIAKVRGLKSLMANLEEELASMLKINKMEKKINE